MPTATIYSPRGRFANVELSPPRVSYGMWSATPSDLARALVELRCPSSRVVTDTTFQVRDREGKAIATFYKE